MKLNKPTNDAIERNLPLFLEWDYWRTIRVIALTAENENGSVRTRKLYEGDLPKILDVCRAVFAAGGSINIDSLPWRDMPGYEISTWLNWSLALEPGIEELRKMWSARKIVLQPQW